MIKTKPRATVSRANKLVRKPSTVPHEGTPLILPADILLLLFDFFTSEDLAAFSLVCKYYHAHATREDTWKAKAGIRGNVPANMFTADHYRARLSNPYIRYFVLSLEIGKVYIAGVEKYVNSHSLMKCLAESSPDSVLLDMHEKKPQLVCYGIYKSNRLDLVIKLKIDPKLEMYWGSVLDALVANNDPIAVEEFLQFPIDFVPPLDPLTSAFNACDEIWNTLVSFYTRGQTAKFCCDVMRMAFMAGQLSKASDMLREANGVVDGKTHVHLMGAMKTKEQFEFYCGLLTCTDDYLRTLFYLIENDCRNVEWMETLEEKIGYVPIDECLAIASEKDNVSYYKYLIRRGSIKMSEIIVDLNAIIFKRRSLVFFTMNRHPDMPPIIMSRLNKFCDDEIRNFFLPYVLDSTKKRIDPAKLEKFCVTYPKARFYLTKK